MVAYGLYMYAGDGGEQACFNLPWCSNLWAFVEGDCSRIFSYFGPLLATLKIG